LAAYFLTLSGSYDDYYTIIYYFGGLSSTVSLIVFNAPPISYPTGDYAAAFIMLPMGDAFSNLPPTVASVGINDFPICTIIDSIL
jgi:hypothetical protein